MRIAVALLIIALGLGMVVSADEKDTRVLDPVCRMKIDRGHAKAESQYRGKSYYFCAQKCKDLFDKDPMKYLHKASKFLKFDPICMMRVDPKKAAGKSVYQKTTYYFCNARCKELFEEDPAKFDKALKSEKYQDPVCKRKYPMSEVAARQAYKGKQYYFCCPSCKDVFAKNPDKYIRAK